MSMGKWILLLSCFYLTLNVNAQSLSHTKWVLVSMDDLETGRSKSVSSKMKATLHFDSDTIYSSMLCNHCKGHYKMFKDHKLKMSAPDCSKMFCMGIGTQEKELLNMFTKATRYRLDKGHLFIFTSDHRRITFNRE